MRRHMQIPTHHTQPTRRTATFASALTAAVAAAALLGPAAAPAAAAHQTSASGGYEWPSVDALQLGEPAQEDLVASVTEYVIEGSVDSVDETTKDDGETVVTLSSDILFDTDDASLSQAATTKVGTLVADVPQGASLRIDGHTDSVDSDAHNQDLSERRAKAVAAAVRAARDDLKLDVEGFGETQLKTRESGSDAAVAAARAENRRVELRYGG